jgi:hypothetical protein
MGFGQPPPTGFTSIAAAPEVAFTTPQTGDFIGWNSPLEKWQNFPLALVKSGGLERVLAIPGASSAVTLLLSPVGPSDGIGNIANVFNVTAVGNITFSFAGATNGYACTLSLYITQDGTGGHNMVWPASVRWPGGAEPLVNQDASAVSILVFQTLDGGTIWYGSLVGTDFS